MLKPFLILSAAVLFVIAPAPIPALAAGGPPQDNNPVKPSPAAREKAKKLYSMDCALCHGDNGNGKTDLATSMQLTLSDWTDPKSLATVPDKELFDAIRKGKGDKMPPEEVGRAKDEEVWALIVHIRSFSKGQPSAPAPAGAVPAAPAPANPGR
jgi:mono/diheme cytochrome c family protein